MFKHKYIHSSEHCKYEGEGGGILGKIYDIWCWFCISQIKIVKGKRDNQDEIKLYRLLSTITMCTFRIKRSIKLNKSFGKNIL